MEGWVCPRCGKALAPWVAECNCYRSAEIATSPDRIDYLTYKPDPEEVKRFGQFIKETWHMEQGNEQ